MNAGTFIDYLVRSSIKKSSPYAEENHVRGRPQEIGKIEVAHDLLLAHSEISRVASGCPDRTARFALHQILRSRDLRTDFTDVAIKQYRVLLPAISNAWWSE